jgi:hypothetical protein
MSQWEQEGGGSQEGAPSAPEGDDGGQDDGGGQDGGGESGQTGGDAPA